MLNKIQIEEINKLLSEARLLKERIDDLVKAEEFTITYKAKDARSNVHTFLIGEAPLNTGAKTVEGSLARELRELSIRYFRSKICNIESLLARTGVRVDAVRAATKDDSIPPPRITATREGLD